MGVAAEQLSFGPSTTANTYVLAQAFGEKLGPGDAIIVTNQDHEANTGPWRRLAARGVDVREWQIDPRHRASGPRALWALVDDRVKLVAFPHCSNVVGAVNPVAEICAERCGTMASGRRSMACPTRRMAFPIWARWAPISTCFRPIKPMGRIRG